MILALLLTAVTMGLALAHALEFPGKRRLDERTYRAVQAIYYPGFTIGGLIGELGGLGVLGILVITTPPDRDGFLWTVAALAMQLATHATYWLVTHPVNGTWVKNTAISTQGRLFFGLLAAPEGDWTRMRDVWEWSHVARAIFATLAFLAVAMAFSTGMKA